MLIRITAQSTSLMSQREFLGYMGLGMRAEALMKQAKDDEQARRIEDAALRLVDAIGMGQQYKVLGFVPKIQHVSTDPASGTSWQPPFPFNMVKSASASPAKP